MCLQEKVIILLTFDLNSIWVRGLVSGSVAILIDLKDHYFKHHFYLGITFWPSVIGETLSAKSH